MSMAAPRFDPKSLLAPGKNHQALTAEPTRDQPPNSYEGYQPAWNDEDEHAQSSGMLYDQLHNVELRQEPATKRQKTKHIEDDESDLVPTHKPENAGPHGGGDGELGTYIKVKQREGAEKRAAAPSSVIDLTEDKDDDVVVVQDNMDREVCAGRIEGARINSHRIPSPKLSGFTGTQKTWPAMKVNLSRRPGTNTHIIGVSDQLNKDFGTIDVRTASVLAPLMDSVKTSKVRLAAKLDPRPKKPYEFPGQPASEHYGVTIIIYAPRKMVAGIGKLFMQHQVFLRDPPMLERGIDLVNPHAPKDHTPKRGLASSSSRYIAGATVVRTAEEARSDISKIFDSLHNTDNLAEAPQPEGIKTPLLKHQRQALHFMTEREKDKRKDPDANDETSLWQKEDRRGKPSWYNVITGHTVSEEPEPVLGGILADVMGLGKTLNVLSLVTSTKDEALAFQEQQDPPEARYEDDAQGLVYNNKATLLICPLSTVTNWEDQIKQHVKKTKENKLDYIVYHGTNRTNEPRDLEDYDIIITTYSVVAADSEKRSRNRPRNPLGEINWFRIVLDEGHIIREQSTRQSKTVCALSAERRWAVTGTPVQNRLEDLGALIKFLKIRPFDEPRNFNQYIIAPFKTADVEILPKLRLLVDSITLRRLKDKINLPERTEDIVRLPMSDAERSFYDFFAAESTKNVKKMLEAEKMAGKGYAHVLKAILRLRLMCAAGSDLLSDEDWDAARGFNINTAIDLEDEENTKPDRTPRAAFELFKMMRDTNNNFCAECNTFVRAREVIENDEDEDDGASSEASRTPDTFGYIAGCNQLICNRCIKDFRRRCDQVAGPDHFGHCPSCETYTRMTFFELKQVEFDAEELAQREIRANPRLAKQAGRYSGPHTKTKALIMALEEDARESATFEEGVAPLKSVVFSGWTSHLDLIQLALTNSEINYTRLDGSMTRKARRAALDAFATDKDITCILVSIAAGGLGLNLTAASRVYVMEPQYNPAQEEQAVERVHRLGQKREVKIMKYIMQNSFEEKMLVLQSKKKALADMSMEKNRTMPPADQAKKRMEDLRTLFK